MASTSKINSVAIYCGSSNGNDPAFSKAAEDIGKLLLKRNISLVYGGGSKGIMGVVARTVHNGGGKVLGIIPEFFVETTKPLIGETIVVKDMHTRKQMICEKADAFIALPGGIGTIEEIVEMICWSHLKLHHKPVGMLNVNNYYDKFFEWYATAVDEGFINRNESTIINQSHDCEKLLDILGGEEIL